MLKIEERIKELEIEMAALQTLHDAVVAEYQQVVSGYQSRLQKNQNRFQQISGALEELRQLNNGKEES